MHPFPCPVRRRPAGLADAVEEMLRSGFLDGLVRLLETRFPGVRDVYYEDTVAESVAKLLERGEKSEIANPLLAD